MKYNDVDLLKEGIYNFFRVVELKGPNAQKN
jgi:hypothetical protein